MDFPYQVGALYHRRNDIHALLGGQLQGGISTPKNNPVVIAFTGEAGKSHGYDDFWDDDRVFHYFGEGQSGDMRFEAGNSAIQQHVANGEQLILFQMMGKSRPCRYLGEFVCISSYLRPDTPATRGPNRTAIVFCLVPKEDSAFFAGAVQAAKPAEAELGSTVTLQLVEVRKKQALFRRRLLGVEKECRITGVADLRFLRASHIKPWAACMTADERTDGHNGVLLTPSADLLFDRGWITFENKGVLVVTDALPKDVQKRIGFKLSSGRKCGGFSGQQQSYLEYHRNQVFEKRFKFAKDPLEDLMGELQEVVAPV